LTKRRPRPSDNRLQLTARNVHSKKFNFQRETKFDFFSSSVWKSFPTFVAASDKHFEAEQLFEFTLVAVALSSGLSRCVPISGNHKKTPGTKTNVPYVRAEDDNENNGMGVSSFSVLMHVCTVVIFHE
jgi:hypothetical protein